MTKSAMVIGGELVAYGGDTGSQVAAMKALHTKYGDGDCEVCILYYGREMGRMRKIAAPEKATPADLYAEGLRLAGKADKRLQGVISDIKADNAKAAAERRERSRAANLKVLGKKEMPKDKAG